MDPPISDIQQDGECRVTDVAQEMTQQEIIVEDYLTNQRQVYSAESVKRIK